MAGDYDAETIILGGGLTAAALAYFLQRPVEILERDAEPGGLCRSFRRDGFTYDIGGHIIFSRDREILELMVKALGDNAERHYRNVKIWFQDRFVKYPFENGIGELEPEDVCDCLLSYLQAPAGPPRNFAEWLVTTFGRGLADRYLLPYNRKIWKTDPAELGLKWVERVPRPPLEDIVRSAVGIATEGYKHQLYFHYPRAGGIVSLVRAFLAGAPRARLITGFKVTAIERDGDGWLVANEHGDRRRARQLVSTLPAPELAALLGAAFPAAGRAALKRLRHNSMFVVLVGVRGELPDLADKLAVYLPQPEIPFHRLVVARTMSANNVPAGMSGLVAEITTPPGGDAWRRPGEAVAGETVDALARLGWVEPDQVALTEVRRVPYAYVINTLTQPEDAAAVRDACRDLEIEPCGRFAEWEYLNMDACVRRARDLAGRL